MNDNDINKCTRSQYIKELTELNSEFVDEIRIITKESIRRCFKAGMYGGFIGITASTLARYLIEYFFIK